MSFKLGDYLRMRRSAWVWMALSGSRSHWSALTTRSIVAVEAAVVVVDAAGEEEVEVGVAETVEEVDSSVVSSHVCLSIAKEQSVSGTVMPMLAGGFEGSMICWQMSQCADIPGTHVPQLKLVKPCTCGLSKPLARTLHSVVVLPR